MDQQEFELLLNGSLKSIYTGEVVTGIVTAVDDDKAIYLDLGTKVTGYIAKEQLLNDQNQKIADNFKVGDEVKAFVIQVKDGEGVAILSKIRCDLDEGWVKMGELRKEKTVIDLTISEVSGNGVKGYYNNCPVYIPASQTDTPRDTDLHTLIGTTHKVVIMKVDDSKKSAIGSIKIIAAAERKEAKEAAKKEALAKIKVGEQITGVVKSFKDFGAFIDLGGIDGMVHNSELSWKKISKPSDVLSIGQEVIVKVLSVDVEKERIALSYRSDENDPWFLFKQAHKVGEVIEGTVKDLLPFGAFVTVADGVDGLIPLGLISLEHINQPSDKLVKGQVVNAKIIEMNDEKRRPTLSIKSLEYEKKKAEEAEIAKQKYEEKRKAKEEADKERAEIAPYIYASI